MDLKTEVTENNLLCTACLCVGRSLHELTDSLKQFYLDTVKEVPLSMKLNYHPLVCWECKAVLKKMVSFREQVKDAYRILETYSSDNIEEFLVMDLSRPPRLKIHSNECVTIPFEFGTKESQTIVSQTTNTPQFVPIQAVYYVKDEKFESTEIKNEYYNCDTNNIEYNSDHSNVAVESDSTSQNVDYSNTREIKKKKSEKSNRERKIKKPKKVVERSQQKKPAQKKVIKGSEKKILSVELTYEEMLAERAKAAAKESYLKAEYKCNSCLIGFNIEMKYKEHIKNRHSIELGDYSCPICESIIPTVESFTTHYKRHLKIYECSVCGIRMTDRRAIQQHYDVTHDSNVKEYKCDICDNISKTIDAYRYHKDTHKARVECSKCDKTFSHRAGLMNHTEAVHKLNNVFPCSECGKVFRWRSSLKKHMTIHDKNADTAAAAAHCASCDVTFKSHCSYQRHLRNSLKHVTVQQHKFICDTCDRRFSNKTKLRDHIEEKHLHRTFTCNICQKPSKNRVCLEQHLRNVHRARPKKCVCHLCGKAFPTKVQLESHIRSHTGERPFICEFCPTTFSQQSNLYKHNRQVHLNQKTKRSAVKKTHTMPMDGHEQDVNNLYKI